MTAVSVVTGPDPPAASLVTSLVCGVDCKRCSLVFRTAVMALANGARVSSVGGVSSPVGRGDADGAPGWLGRSMSASCGGVGGDVCASTLSGTGTTAVVATVEAPRRRVADLE